MIEYYFAIVWVGIITVFSPYFYEKNIDELNNKKLRWGFAILSIVPLVLFAAMRSKYFMDTQNYIEGYLYVPDSLSDAISYAMAESKDKGWIIVEYIFKIIIGNKPRVFLGIIAFSQLISLIKIYRKYSYNYCFALFVFIASTDYYSWMFNGIRQFTAVMLIFAFSDWIFEKKYFRMILLILIASTIHFSALIMIPIIFLVQGEAFSKKTLFAAFCLVAIIFSIENFTNLLDNVLVDTQYNTIISQWKNGTHGNDTGTNFLRIIVYSVPTILAIIGKKSIKNSQNHILNVVCNMSILSTAFYILSGFTSGIFVGRIPIYCSLYASGILLPWEIENLFTKGSKKIIYIIAVVCYICFYYYQLVITWNVAAFN